MFILEKAIQDYCLCPYLLHDPDSQSRYLWKGSCRNTWKELAEIIQEEVSNAFGYGVEEDWGIEVRPAQEGYSFWMPVLIGRVGFRVTVSRIQMNLDTNTLILIRNLNAYLTPERQEAEGHIVKLLCHEARDVLKSPLIQHFEVRAQQFGTDFGQISRDLDWEDAPELYEETLTWATMFAEAFSEWREPHLERCGFCKWFLCPDRRAGNPIPSLLGF